jgi:ATP-binding cassette subfamily B protein
MSMLWLKNKLGLSDEGYRDLKRGVSACVLSNLSLLLPFGIIIQLIVTLLEPLTAGAALDVSRLRLCFGVGVAAAVLHFFAYRGEYRKTYTAAYSESEKIRL